jgi:hypothetical protein
MNAQKLALSTWQLISFYYQYGTIAKLAHNHNTTQNTTPHILHNNQQNELPPYPQRLCPLSPWVEQQRPQVLAPPLPDAICRSQAIGLALNVVGSFIWGGKMRGIKNTEGAVPQP